ncbi:MAG: hypothetical protein KatS3mg060_1585 [Dehalococcoidia bacterium]|nr:MAG: hypothetical protein KatS3mg060_1585 [Dehalococcoidia bacterium]
MKHKVRFAMAAALILPAVVAVRAGEVPTAQAQGAGPALCSGIQLQNTNTGQNAAVTMNFYRVGGNDGVADATISDTLGPNGSKSYYLPNALPSGTPDGQYSVVTNADQALNALVQQVTCPGSSPSVAASFSGVGSADTGSPVVLPFVLSRAFPTAGNFSSFVAIQNAGTATATNVQIQFFPAGSGSPIETFTNNNLPVGETWYLNLRSGTYATTALNGFNGSAVVTSDQPVAAVVNYSPGDNTSLLSYNGARTTGTTLFSPQATKAYFGFTSGFTVVNRSAVDTTVRYRMVGSASGSPVDVSIDRPLLANATDVFYLGNPPAAAVPNNFNGTAIISIAPGAPSAQLIGIANLAIADPTVGAASGAMNLIPSTQGAQRIYFPQMSKAFFGFTSGWQLVDTAGSGASGTARYFQVNPDGSVTQIAAESFSVPANGSITTYLGNVGSVPNNFNGGVVVELTSGSVAGQGNYNGTGSGDVLTVYNGFPG